jgi:hypothetical protein
VEPSRQGGLKGDRSCPPVLAVNHDRGRCSQGGDPGRLVAVWSRVSLLRVADTTPGSAGLRCPRTASRRGSLRSERRY